MKLYIKIGEKPKQKEMYDSHMKSPYLFIKEIFFQIKYSAITATKIPY